MHEVHIVRNTPPTGQLKVCAFVSIGMVVRPVRLTTPAHPDHTLREANAILTDKHQHAGETRCDDPAIDRRELRDDHADTAARLQSTRDELERTHQILEEVQRVAHLGYWILDIEAWTFEWSEEAFQIWGRDPDLGSPDYREYVQTLPHDDRDTLRRAGERAVQTGEAFEIEHRVIRPSGEIRWVRLQGRVVEDRPRMVGAVQDITEQRQLEAQLRQSQKMEAVGRLAGGVAHDFNNLLTAIFSFTEFAMEGLEPADERAADMREVLHAAERARELTSQLLAFSRRKAIQPEVIDVNDAVRKTDRMLRRLLGEDIAYETDLSSESAIVQMDPGALEQVLVNLAVNARDAMPGGGRLSIETRIRTLEACWDPVFSDPIQPGEYVTISVRDTGHGMNPETVSRVFEPFFTTKKPGEGTGLGLSTCFGIVRQAEGHIQVESTPGEGTTFTVCLPRNGSAVSEASSDTPDAPLGGSETILVVEDHDQVRKLALRTLSRYGYHPIEAATPREAIAIVSRHPELKIDLLLTDVVMPEMNGRELADVLIGARPDMRVLFMSGYTGENVSNRDVLPDGPQLLEKPFPPDRLVAAVRATLAESGR
jgi:PAS domain S-box-containing protein